MQNYEVDVNYLDKIFDTIHIEADSREQAEYEALNRVRDANPDASNLDVLEVREVG